VPLIVAGAALHRVDVEKDISSQPADSSGSSEMTAADEDVISSVVHRKHKKMHRSVAAAAAASAAPALQDLSLATEEQVPLVPLNPYRKPANPYVAYRNIKMKVNGLWFFR